MGIIPVATIPETLALALQHHQAGRLREAEAMYRQILVANPMHVDALQLLGLLAHQVGRNDLAVELIGRAIQLDDGVAAFHNNIGLAYHQLGKNGEAEAAFRRAIALDPNYVEALFNLGNCMHSQNRLVEAEPLFRRVLAISPKHLGAMNNLAISLWGSGRLTEAVAICRTALAIDPQLVEANTTLGICLYRDDDPAPAARAFEVASAAPSRSELPLFYLAICLDQLGQSERARMCFARLARDPNGYSSLIDSWEYVKRRRPPATRSFSSSFETLDFALALARPDGLTLEFGVRFGHSIRFIASRTSGLVHGFDSFEGLPEAWGENPKGAFSTGGRLPEVPPNVHLHVGLFAQVLPSFLAQHQDPVRFMNVDCDLYSSTSTIFDLIGHRLRPGTVIVFDEYLCNPRWRFDEYKAFQEAVERFGFRYEYRAFNIFTRQAVVRILQSRSSHGSLSGK
jgi:tetratricopeptide (TPR) repeat protein